MIRRSRFDPRLQATSWAHAGALLHPALDPTLPDDARPLDPATLTAWRHPLLGDALMVRLCPVAVAPADAADLEQLGFERAYERPGLALQRPTAPPFPQNHLVRAQRRADSASVRRALSLAHPVAAALRALHHAPEAAWQQLEQAAAPLARDNPAWLPDLYEAWGRAALQRSLTHHATRAFHKARDAERAHELPIDERRLARVYLEFALGGALSITDLEAWARDMERRCPPPLALELFRWLCVQRTSRGLHPWAGMIKDLRRLARAADQHPTQEERRLLREILPSGALVRAPASFWQDSRASIVVLAQEDPALRHALLHLMPGHGQSRGYHASWLHLLDECGALDDLLSPPPSPDAQPAPLAAWFNRALAHVMGGKLGEDPPASFFGLLRRAAPRLRDEGALLKLAPHGRADLDLVDLALELKLPVLLPDGHVRVNLLRWAKPHERTPERPRTLDFIALEATWEPPLLRALDEAFGHPDAEQALRRARPLRGARGRWLKERAERLRAAPLQEWPPVLDALLRAARPGLAQDLPDAWAELDALDPAAPLCRAARALDPDDPSPVTLDEARRWLREPEANLPRFLAHHRPDWDEPRRLACAKLAAAARRLAATLARLAQHAASP